MRTFVSIVAALLSLVGALAIGPASASASGISKVTLSQNAPYWHGMVLSEKFGGSRSCEHERVVKVFKRQGGKDRLIGKDTTSRSGRWVVSDQPIKGSYYAKLTARPAGKKPACRGDESSSVTVD